MLVIAAVLLYAGCGQFDKDEVIDVCLCQLVLVEVGFQESLTHLEYDGGENEKHKEHQSQRYD